MKGNVLAIACAASMAAAGCDPLMTACTDELGYSVEPAAQTLRIGQSFMVHARAWSCGGRETVPIDVVWMSSDSTVVRVDQNGKVTALSVGTAKVRGIDQGWYGAGPFEVPVTVR